MKVLHIGSSTVSYSRFLDFIKDDRLAELYILSDERDNLFKKIQKSCADKEEFKKYSYKLKEILFKHTFVYICLDKLFNYAIKFGFASKVIRIILLLLSPLIELYLKCYDIRNLTNFLNDGKIDIVWSGSNNFDRSNLLTWFFALKYNHKIIRVYKETNGEFTLDEYKSLKASSGLIFPNDSTLNHFESLYNDIDFSKKPVLYADEDLRYSNLILKLRKNDLLSNKLSKIDKKPHVVILSGRVTYGNNDSFTNNRYNYLNLISDLISKEIHVHLHCAFFFNSDIRKIVTHNNHPYYDLMSSNEFFHIEGKLDLEANWDDYLTLNKYDAGILHNYDPSDVISTFSSFNIPNRLYEYQAANVQPIIIKGTMNEVEKIIRHSKFGIIGESYDDIALKLYESIKDDNFLQDQYIQSFDYFTDTFFKMSDLLKLNQKTKNL